MLPKLLRWTLVLSLLALVPVAAATHQPSNCGDAEPLVVNNSPPLYCEALLQCPSGPFFSCVWNWAVTISGAGVVDAYGPEPATCAPIHALSCTATGNYLLHSGESAWVSCGSKGTTAALVSLVCNYVPT